MKKLLLKIGHYFIVLYWRIFKPITLGVRIIISKENKVLLVKHTYSKYWYLPGGGVKKNETYEQAICREIEEELGYKINKLKLFGVYNNNYEGKIDSIVVFRCIDGEFVKEISSQEIEDYAFFDLCNLPKETSNGTKKE
jgi:ADP-ribose pyrophosphatase YjhB (NUDIX family)